MKRLNYILFAFLFVLVGVGVINANEFVVADENIEIVPIHSEAEFIDTLASSYNYSGKKIVLYKDLDFSDYKDDISRIWQVEESFSSDFDGNGYSLNNLTFYSKNQNFGLFPNAVNANIKNVKFGGNLTFNIQEKEKSQVTVGCLVGYGNNVLIENCEIAEDAILLSKNNAEDFDTLQFSTKITFGGIAGELVTSSLSNCVNHANIDLTTSLTASSIIKMGGIVGRILNSEIKYCVSYSNLSYFASTANILYYNGGIVGEVEGSSAKVIDCAYGGSILPRIGDNFAESNNGGIIGSISTAYHIDNGGISFVYWTDNSLPAFGRNDNYNFDANNVKNVSVLTTSFFANMDNWHKLYNDPAWDFDNTWISIVSVSGQGSRLHLQWFQQFKYKMADQLDTGSVIDKEKATFTGGKFEDDAYLYRYGQEVVINIEFTPSTQGYYTLTSILLDANALDANSFAKEEITDINGRVLGYKITLSASAKTDGVYSFVVEPISFNCIAETEDVNKGGVKFRGGSNTTKPSLPLTLSFQSQEQTIVAESNAGSIYTFDHWDLYYMQNGTWVKQTDFISNSSMLTIKFGIHPYNRQFRLVANFTDKEALNASFRGDEHIKKINFDGRDYEGQAMKVSSTATSIDLIVTVEKGYELDMDKFIETVAKLYGAQSTNSLSPSSKKNDEGELEYKFRLNMVYIKENLNLNNNDFMINITSVVLQSDEENNLLWLWITLPIVGVLLIGGVVIFIVVRNYRFKHGAGKFGGTAANGKITNKKSKDKPKKNDFKDFYY